MVLFLFYFHPKINSFFILIRIRKREFLFWGNQIVELFPSILIQSLYRPRETDGWNNIIPTAGSLYTRYKYWRRFFYEAGRIPDYHNRSGSSPDYDSDDIDSEGSYIISLFSRSQLCNFYIVYFL